MKKCTKISDDELLFSLVSIIFYKKQWVFCIFIIFLSYILSYLLSSLLWQTKWQNVISGRKDLFWFTVWGGIVYHGRKDTAEVGGLLTPCIFSHKAEWPGHRSSYKVTSPATDPHPKSSMAFSHGTINLGKCSNISMWETFHIQSNISPRSPISSWPFHDVKCILPNFPSFFNEWHSLNYLNAWIFF